MILSIIAVVADNRVIGNNNKLPWHLPADFKYFKEKTLGKTIILGLNTFKSISSKPLPNRKHIVLSKESIKLPDSCYLAKSIEEALEITKRISPNDEVMICGGAMVYQQFLPLANRMYLTYIHQDFEGDTFFPEFDKNEWQEVSKEDHQPDEKNKYSYSFVVLERK